MNPYLKYKQQTEAVSWTRIDMLLALYDGAIERLTAASKALKVNDRRTATPLLSKAQLIVSGLASGVRTDQNQELATNLLVLFEFVVHRISLADESSIDDALKILHTLRQGYETVRPQAADLERQGKVPRAEAMRMVQGIA